MEFSLKRKVMDVQQLDPNELERWERIDGIIYDMSPSPSTDHQRIVARLFNEFSNYLKGKQCEIFVSPFDVYLNADESGDFVKPDIVVVCDQSKIRENGFYGAPDMVIEVLSKKTVKKEREIKLRAYKTSGVIEYWIVDPAYELVQVYNLQGSEFPSVYDKDEVIKVGIFDDLEINLAEIFS